MFVVKTKEGASLRIAGLATIAVALALVLVSEPWWVVLCAAAGTGVLVALFSLLVISKYVAYKLKPIYSIVLSRDVHTKEIFTEMKEKHVEHISEELTAWADTNDKEIEIGRAHV